MPITSTPSSKNTKNIKHPRGIKFNLVGRMCHCIAKVCILELLKEKQAMRVPELLHSTVSHHPIIPITQLIITKKKLTQQHWIFGSHYELGVLRTLPILKIFQVPNKRFIFKVPILSQIVDVCGICETLDELQFKQESLPPIIWVFIDFWGVRSSITLCARRHRTEVSSD